MSLRADDLNATHTTGAADELNPPEAMRGRMGEVPRWLLPEDPFDYRGLVDRDSGIAQVHPEKLGSRVAVVGAGSAGLCAAYELARVGLKPVVYEAGERLGGRTWSYRFPGDPKAIAELGAMRVPASHKTVQYYIDAFGLQRKAFPAPGNVPTLLLFQRRRYMSRGSHDMPAAVLDALQAWHSFVDRLIEDFRQAGTDPVTRLRKWNEYVERFRDQSFFNALVNQGLDRRSIEMFGSLGLGAGGFDPLFNVSFVEILRLMIMQGGHEYHGITGGIDQIAGNFWRARPHCRYWGDTSVAELNGHSTKAALTDIALDNGQVTLRDRAGDVDQFDAAIVTVPLRALQMTVNFERRVFSERVRRAMRRVHHIESTKVFVRTDSAFWRRRPDIPRCLVTDEASRQSYFFDFADTQSGVVCLSYVWGDDSTKYLPLTDKERVDAARRAIQPLFGEDIFSGRIAEWVSVSWEQMPGFHGAFKLTQPGQYEDQWWLYNQGRGRDCIPDSGVYLAGDGVSFLGGWIEGALQSGLNSALAAVNRVNSFAEGEPA